MALQAAAGARPELHELMKVPGITALQARSLFMKGICSPQVGRNLPLAMSWEIQDGLGWFVLSFPPGIHPELFPLQDLAKQKPEKVKEALQAAAGNRRPSPAARSKGPARRGKGYGSGIASLSSWVAERAAESLVKAAAQHLLDMASEAALAAGLALPLTDDREADVRNEQEGWPEQVGRHGGPTGPDPPGLTDERPEQPRLAISFWRH